MSTLSPERKARHAHDAGFRGQDLTIAVAVALAESGGDPRAHNSTPPDDSYGLWQVNMLGSLGPARRREFGLDSDSDLFSPAENARAANRISGDGRDWT
ncbi:transglycosylase SLT domain-containing protein, partial [Saccharothrix sp. MB29]|nr:transglycosylase SLT domain-containing protein [Saccharothrix sp. MB29]